MLADIWDRAKTIWISDCSSSFVVDRMVIYVSAGANVRTTSYVPGSNFAIESASSK
jgi:hypothetical protein